MRRTIAYLTIICALCSCGIYGKWEKGSADPSVSYRSQTDTTSSIAELSWREFFTDERLQALIEEALENNANIQIARLRLDQQKAMLTSARLAYLPTISASAKENVLSGNFQIGADASWQFDLFGKATTAKRAAQARTLAAEDYVQAVQNDLIATVASGYCNLLMLDRSIEISEQTLLNWDKYIAALEGLKEAGRSNELAIIQAGANRKNLQASILSLKLGREDAENALCALLGRPSGAIERGVLEDMAFPESLATGVPANILSRRPDVRRAEDNLAAAFYTTRNAFANLFPDISLSGALGWTVGGNAVPSPGELVRSLVAGITAPLLSHRSRAAAYKSARLEQEATGLAYRQTVLDAANEVNAALGAIETARGRMVLDMERRDMMEDAVVKTELLMQYTSTTSYLEVLTAQQSLLSARNDLLSDTATALSQTISLYRALGGGSENTKD